MTPEENQDPQGLACVAVTFSVRLDATAAQALADLCHRWRCRRAEAVRRALLEAAGQGEILDRLARIESLVAAPRPPYVVTADSGPTDAPVPGPEPDAAAAATIRNLGSWGAGEA